MSEMCSCDQIMRELAVLRNKLNEVREACSTVQVDSQPRKKRAPSKYNLFLKECIPKKSGPITERFSACVAEYKQQK